MHNVIVVNPGHFHAALTLRERHPMLRDDVYVYAEDGADLERFLGIVQTFNDRTDQPTCWKLHVYRGADYLAKLISERRGKIAVIAGKNDSKLDAIHRGSMNRPRLSCPMVPSFGFPCSRRFP